MTLDERYPKRLEILALLEHEPMTAVELSGHVGQSPSRVRHHVNALHDEKRIYVYDWKRTLGRTGAMSAIYKKGNRKDKPKPDRHEMRLQAQRRHYANNRIAYSLKRRAKLGQLNPFSQFMCGVQQVGN